MLGGLLIGLIEIFVKVYIAPGWYEAITYAILIVVLLDKPAGILGKNVGEKYEEEVHMPNEKRKAYLSIL